MAAWLVIKAFFPNLAKKIKGAIFGLLSKIPFVGKFFKGKGGEDEGDDNAAEEAKEKAASEKGETEEALSPEKEEVKPEEKSSGMFGGLFGGGDKPKPEASPATSYSGGNNAQSNGPVHISPDVVEKLTSAIEALKTSNVSAAESIVDAMRKSSDNQLLMSLNRIHFPIRAIMNATIGTLLAIRGVATRMLGIIMTVRGIPTAMNRISLAINGLKTAFNPVNSALREIQRLLMGIRTAIRLSAGVTAITGLASSMFSIVSSTAGGMFSKVTGIFSSKEKNKEEKKNQMREALASTTINANIVSDKSSEKNEIINSIREASVQKGIPQTPKNDNDTIVINGVEIDRFDYESAKKNHGLSDKELQAKPWMMYVDFKGDSDDILDAKREWELKVKAAKQRRNAEASANQETPQISNERIEKTEVTANTVNSNSLISQKNSIETMKVQNQQIQNENKEKAIAMDDDREEKRMEALPRAIALGLAAYFDGRELTLKGSSEPENILTIKQDDKASDF